jgi:hypothetical protein
MGDKGGKENRGSAERTVFGIFDEEDEEDSKA